MHAVIRREIEVAAPARVVWEYVTDWPKQGEWIPGTRVEVIDEGHAVGGRIRAWTGVGRLGFWDTMTITAWSVEDDGSARCEVLHTGKVVRGTGEFAVMPHGPDRCTFLWGERLILPFGRLGAVAWKLASPLAEAVVDLSLRRMVRRVLHRSS